MGVSRRGHGEGRFTSANGQHQERGGAIEIQVQLEGSSVKEEVTRDDALELGKKPDHKSVTNQVDINKNIRVFTIV